MNHTIWMLWLQGWDDAPDVAQRCRDSFVRMNPGWNVCLLDETTYPLYLGDQAERICELSGTVPPAALSDLIRIELLRRHGGVWADATVLCLRPLDEWLSFVGGETLFAFRDPGPDRRLSSWFLTAPPADPIVAAWAEACKQYWAVNNTPDEYHWFHYEFAATLEREPRLEAIWDAADYLSAKVPHHLLPHHRKLNAAPTPEDLAIFSGSTAPVLKLSHKIDGDPQGPTNYATITRDSAGLAMHYPPRGTSSNLVDRVVVVHTSKLPDPVEALRTEVIATYFTIRGAAVRVVTSTKESSTPDIVIDVREELAEAPLDGFACPVITCNSWPQAPHSDTDQPLFTFGLAGGYIPYVDPAMCAAWPGSHWSAPSDTVALLGLDPASDALHSARHLCHEFGLATEHVPASDVHVRQDLAGHACGIADRHSTTVFAERQSLPCLTLAEAIERPDRILDAASLTTAERENRRRRLVRRSELTLASVYSVAARLV